MKNRYILTISLFIITSTFTSCKKLIEIPENPTGQISEKQVFTDSTTVMGAVANVYNYSYNAVSTNRFAYDDALFTLTTALSSDELATSSPNEALDQFYQYSLNSLNYTISSLWSRTYSAIYPANAIINNLENGSPLPPTFTMRISSEMKVMRSLYYFNLINLYGDTPLVLTTDYTTSKNMGRTPVSNVYAQIIKDLETAKEGLSATYISSTGSNTTDRYHPNKYTAAALLAKAYLYTNEWQKAYNEADAIINSGIYQLEPTLENVFLQGSKEAIWQLPALSSGYQTAEGNKFIKPAPFMVPDFIFNPSYINSFETGDKRLQKWIGLRNIAGQNYYYPNKYRATLNTSTPKEDYMIFRLGEIYLIRAEASLHLQNYEQALSDLNTIRNRAGLENLEVQNETDITQAMIQERKNELFCEWGNRWFDLKRLGLAEQILNSTKTGWTKNAALYPIPNTQLQLNSALTQNPGYN